MGIDIKNNQIPAHIFKVILGYEKGEINTETFLWNLQKESAKLTPQPDMLIKAWNAMFLGWNSKRFEFLEELQKEYSLFILSNTNELHLEWINKDLKKNHNIADFDTRFFEKAFYSHLMRMRKPEVKIFEQVLSELGINANETLFIDDKLENVEKAKMAGFCAAYHDSKNEIIDSIKGYIAEYN